MPSLKKSAAKSSGGHAVEVKRIKVHESGTLRAFVDVVVNGVTIYGCRFIEGSKGFFVAFPAREGEDKDGEKKYFNHVWIDDKDLKKAVDEAVSEAYEKA